MEEGRGHWDMEGGEVAGIWRGGRGHWNLDGFVVDLEERRRAGREQSDVGGSGLTA